MDTNLTGPSTRAVHAGEPANRPEGAVTMPIFQSSTYLHPDPGHDLRYIRLNNTPNHQVVAAKLAALEQTDAAVVTASGMAAITAAILSVCRAGDHILFQRQLYGGTHGLVHHDLEAFGIAWDLVDPDDAGNWREKLRPETRAIYLETISNPLMRVADLQGAVDFARQNGLVSMIDNTFAGPLLFRPVPFGFDLSIHSATKYLNGHSDLVAGVVLGSSDRIERVKEKLLHLGGCLDPHGLWLLQRGLKTLALRTQRHAENAMAIARFLDGHPAIRKVHYPGLPHHQGHERARRWFDGFGGMLAFEPSGGVPAADDMIRRMRLALVAPSLGGVESLVTRPVQTSHSGLSAEQRRDAGLCDELIRFSTGIEDTADLLADFDQALTT